MCTFTGEIGVVEAAFPSPVRVEVWMSSFAHKRLFLRSLGRNNLDVIRNSAVGAAWIPETRMLNQMLCRLKVRIERKRTLSAGVILFLAVCSFVRRAHSRYKTDVRLVSPSSMYARTHHRARLHLLRFLKRFRSFARANDIEMHVRVCHPLSAPPRRAADRKRFISVLWFRRRPLVKQGSESA